jgi:hypothetical protein
MRVGQGGTGIYLPIGGRLGFCRMGGWWVQAPTGGGFGVLLGFLLCGGKVGCVGLGLGVVSDFLGFGWLELIDEAH